MTLTAVRGPWNEQYKRPARNRALPIAAWGIIFCPAILAEKVDLLKRGHLRYENFSHRREPDGDEALAHKRKASFSRSIS